MTWAELAGIVAAHGLEDTTPVWFVDLAPGATSESVQVLWHDQYGAGLTSDRSVAVPAVAPAPVLPALVLEEAPHG